MVEKLTREQYRLANQDPETLTRLNREFNRYRTARNKWATRALEYEMVVNNDVDGTGTQFTSQELDAIKERCGIPLSVNLSVAFVEQLQSFLTSAKPSVTCIPIGDSSKPYAYIHREIINTLLYLNDFYIKQEKTIFDMAVVGHGIMFVTLANFFSQNAFNVNIKNLDWRNCYFDPMSKETDYQDSEMVFIVFPMIKSKAKKVYNLSDEDMRYASAVLEDSQGMYNYDSVNGVDVVWGTPESDSMIWVYEVFEKINATLNVLKNGKKTFDEPVSEVDEQGNIVKLVNGIEVVDSIDSTFVKRYLKVGNFIKDERIMPIQLYPFAIYNHTHNRNPMPYGLVHHFVDLQHTFNKVLALTLQNAETTSNNGWWVAEGTVTDKSKTQREISTPGSMSEYTADPTLPNGGIPYQRIGAPLNNAWYSLGQQLIKFIEYITGIYELSMGNSENAPNTVGATQSIQNFGSQRPKMYARRIDIANQKLGEILIQFYQAYAPQENLMTLISGTESMVEIQTNVSAIVDQQTKEVKLDPRGQDKATIVKDMVTQQVATILGDIRVGQYKVRFQSASDLPTTRTMALNMLQALMSRMGNDNMAIAIAQASLKLMDYPEIDKVLKDTDVIGQLQQQVQQTAQQLDEVTKANQKLEQENMKLEKDVKLAEMDAEVDKRMARIDIATGHFENMKKEQDKIEKQEQTDSIK